MKRIAVVALGGNSLIIDNQRISAHDQLAVVEQSCEKIAKIVEKGFEVVITHGNGPQVGFNLLRSELAKEKLPPVPMDVCVAETQGSIGYMIQQALKNQFRKRGIAKEVVAVVSEVMVNADDPAFGEPTKPIGPFYNEVEAASLATKQGWVMKEDAGRGYRRVVASPMPVDIVGIEVINYLLSKGVTVVTTGGGGIAVKEQQRIFHGVEAVIDKDHVSSLLARKVRAKMLIISTGVSKVCLNYGKEDQVSIDAMTVSQARRYLCENQFSAGSMRPKVEAAITFLEEGGDRAIVASPEELDSAVLGNSGTHIVPDQKFEPYDYFS